MRTIAAISAAILLSGCVTPRLLEPPAQESFIWDDSAPPVKPLRADSAIAASTVVDYAEQIGLISPARCESSRRAYEVIVSKVEQVFQVVLVHHPEWCPSGEKKGSGERFEWAVRWPNLTLVRERTKTDRFLRDGLLYGPDGLTAEEQARLAQREQAMAQWKERFATRPGPAQEAFRTGKFVLEMTQEDVDLLTKYLEEVDEKFSFQRSGVRETAGGKKRELWVFCKPDCYKQEVAQQVVLQDGVVVLVQTGRIKFN